MKQKFKFSNSSCRCLVRQNDPGSEYLGGHLPSNRANPAMARSRSDTALSDPAALPPPPLPPKKK